MRAHSQMGVLQGVPQLAESWHQLVEKGHVTASELRQLVGGGTQDGAARAGNKRV